jgi:excisionase family DNA binding protein
MMTFSLNASTERIRDAEATLTALLPLVSKRSRYVYLQLEGSQQTITVPKDAINIVVEVLRQLSHGGSVALIQLDEELTTQQAADLLNVSRPYLIGLLDSGVLPSRKVGKHRRVKALDLITYKQADEQSGGPLLSIIPHFAVKPSGATDYLRDALSAERYHAPFSYCVCLHLVRNSVRITAAAHGYRD